MTNIARKVTTYAVEDRSWLRGPFGTGPGENPGVTLDVSTFTIPADGYIRSGTAVSKLPSGLWGPFDAAKTEHGLLFSSLVATNGNVGGAVLVRGDVNSARLPGSPNVAALKTALPLIRFA